MFLFLDFFELPLGLFVFRYSSCGIHEILANFYEAFFRLTLAGQQLLVLGYVFLTDPFFFECVISTWSDQRALYGVISLS